MPLTYLHNPSLDLTLSSVQEPVSIRPLDFDLFLENQLWRVRENLELTALPTTNPIVAATPAAQGEANPNPRSSSPLAFQSINRVVAATPAVHFVGKRKPSLSQIERVPLLHTTRTS